MGGEDKVHSMRDEWDRMQATISKPCRYFEFGSIGTS